MKAGVQRGIKIRIAQNAPTVENPNLDTEFLAKHKAAEVRSLNFQKLVGGGVLHTKFWIVDRKHVYVGSANMDWRALTEVSFATGLILKAWSTLNFVFVGERNGYCHLQL